MRKDYSPLPQIISENLGADTILKDVKNASGGCISHAASLITSKGNFFVKWGQTNTMYLAEKAGLQLLEGKSNLKIPEVLNAGMVADVVVAVASLDPVMGGVDR